MKSAVMDAELAQMVAEIAEVFARDWRRLDAAEAALGRLTRTEAEEDCAMFADLGIALLMVHIVRAKELAGETT